MKKCKICGVEKEYNNYYAHPKTKDGHSQKCKLCAKEESVIRYKKIYESEELIEKERKRIRIKNNRFPRTNDKEKKKSYDISYKNKYYEKYLAGLASSKLEKLKGYNNHHWSYNEVHYLDCIKLTIREHKKAHRFIIYDQERFMYRDLSGVLLDTKERHEKYIRHMIETKED